MQKIGPQMQKTPNPKEAPKEEKKKEDIEDADVEIIDEKDKK